MPLIHVASLVFDTPLLIMREKLEAILSSQIGTRISATTADAAALQSFLRSQSQTQPVDPTLAAVLPSIGEHRDRRVYAGTTFIENKAGYRSDSDSGSNSEKPYCMTGDGIAVIPITGALMKKGSWMSAMSGISSYESIAYAFSAALTDNMVQAILFDIDSPGGTTHGCFELADQIYAARRDKPIWACANDLAASAAYALGSSASKLWLTRTAAVGSIGVYALHVDQSGYDEQTGVKYTYIRAGDKKVDGNSHEPLSRSAKKDIQAEIDRERDMFIDCVSRNREADADKFLALEAGVKFAADACPLLADKVGTIDDCIAALTSELESGGTLTNRSQKRSNKSGGSGGSGGKKAESAELEVSAESSAPTSTPTAADVLQEKVKGESDMALDLQAVLTGATVEELQAALAAKEDKKDPKELKAGKACSACDGTGKIDGKECEACGGSGEMKSAKKAAKADDMKDQDDEDGDGDGDDDKNKGKKAGADDMKGKDKKEAKDTKKDKENDDMDEEKGSKAAMDRIMGMCELAGQDSAKTVRSFVEKHTAGKMSIADIQAELLDRRSTSQRELEGLDATLAVPSNAGNALSSIVQGARQIKAANPQMSKSEALETFVRTHPQAYEQYNDDRRMAKLSGRHGAAYMNSVAPIMRSMGLAVSGEAGVSVGAGSPYQLAGSITNTRK